MSSFDLLPDLAARLDRLVPAEPALGDWADVERRTRPRARRRLLSLKAAVALAVFALLATIATATYFALWGSATPHPGALTVVASGSNPPVAEIVEVLPSGKTAIVWRCPGNVFCGELTGVDWASDGRHVAFTLDEISARSAYIGLHILDIATNRDIHIPHLRLARPMAPQPASAFRRLLRQSDQRLGCRDPGAVAWSPDAKTLAYDCDSGGRSAIFTIRGEGTHHRRIDTRLLGAASPTFSPDGKRIAFAGWSRVSPGGRAADSAIYVMRVDGSRRVLVARKGSLPDWSPDGRTIAYQSPDGMKFVTPAGIDVTPRGRQIGPKGAPAWSPDGKSLAVGTRRGVFLGGATSGRFKRVTSKGVGRLGLVRPAWYPGKTPPRAEPQAQQCDGC
jgi:WD40 repeat protein